MLTCQNEVDALLNPDLCHEYIEPIAQTEPVWYFVNRMHTLYANVCVVLKIVAKSYLV